MALTAHCHLLCSKFMSQPVRTGCNWLVKNLTSPIRSFSDRSPASNDLNRRSVSTKQTKANDILLDDAALSLQKKPLPKNIHQPFLNPVKVTKHLTLFKADEKRSALPAQDRPLVLLFQWLYANTGSVCKYASLYRNEGFDVLAVRGKLAHFLWPPVSLELSHELLGYLKRERPMTENILVHALSVGVYNYSICMEASPTERHRMLRLRERIIGQIFDSIVVGSYRHMSLGISETLPQNKALREAVLQILDVYYNISQNATKATYDSLVLNFKTQYLAVPTIFFTCTNDPMCENTELEAMVAVWKRDRPDWAVTCKTWTQSKHAAHLQTHPDEYRIAWREFMADLKLI